MPEFGSANEIERALRAVGEMVDAAGEHYAIVIVGGAALNLLGLVHRTTRDVDILAFARSSRFSAANRIVPPPDPLPETLTRAIRTVARDFNLSDQWLNTEPSLQLKAGLPRGFSGRVHWRTYRGLRVGIAGRRDLIWFKLFAAVDQGGRHLRDLVVLAPNDRELEAAARWVKRQDANRNEFPGTVDEVVRYVRENR